MKTCDDFPKAPECCDSCHEDDAMGYEMIELHKKDGDECEAYVCCVVSFHLSDKDC